MASHDDSPLQSTRQMLDELDALMERMLSLPVGEAEELPPLPRDVLKAPTLSASLTVLDDPTEEASEEDYDDAPLYSEARQRPRDESYELPALFPREPAPRPKSPAPVEPIEPPVAQHRYYTAPAAELPADDEQEEPEQENLPPPLVANRPVQVVTSPARPRFSPGKFVVKPLVWANLSFDHCTLWLGPLGRALRGPRGRSFLGFAGLTCLGAAGIWYVKQQVGWSW